MRGHARFVHLVRTPLANRIGELRSKPVPEWPQQLQLALATLLQLKVQDQTARQIIIESRVAAQSCARRINCQATTAVQDRMRTKLSAAFLRIGNCVARASSHLRAELDEAVACWNPVDIEAMEEMLEAVGTIFERYRNEKPAQTALRAMSSNITDQGRGFGINIDYSALHPGDHLSLETELTASKGPKRASELFLTMGSVLASDGKKATTQIHCIITDYVADLVGIWERAGLRPSRAVHRDKPDYTSKFHRYTDLVLTVATEPWSRRHDDNLGAARREIHRAAAALLPEIRQHVSTALPRRDVEWLVRDNHIRAALGRVSKN
jgi:hypothetical protein